MDREVGGKSRRASYGRSLGLSPDFRYNLFHDKPLVRGLVVEESSVQIIASADLAGKAPTY